MADSLLLQARKASNLTQEVVAERAGTSQTALSAYERGRVSPTLETVERILAREGFELTITPRIEWTTRFRGPRPYFVPDRLPQLAPAQALARVEFPVGVYWSTPRKAFDLSVRGDRAQAYAIVMREGRGEDIAKVIDGTLLVDIWDELVLPVEIRDAWQPLIDSARVQV